jgi:hypothetical protein
LFCYNFASADSKAFRRKESHRNSVNRLAILQVLKMNDLGDVKQIPEKRTPGEHRRYRESPQYYLRGTIRQVPFFVKMKNVLTKKKASAPAFG